MGKMLHRQAPVQPLLSSGVNTRQLGNKSKDDKLKELDRKVRKPEQVQKSRDAKREPTPAADSGSDKEKAALIMQVMNLTPDQINMLPLEQRKSILELRAQLANQR